MQNKVSPAIIAVAVVAALLICFFIYKRTMDSGSGRQLAPTTDSFKPGYSGSGSSATNRPAPGSGAPGTSSAPPNAPGAPPAPGAAPAPGTAPAPTGSGTGQ